jgi:hypothetical protein
MNSCFVASTICPGIRRLGRLGVYLNRIMDQVHRTFRRQSLQRERCSCHCGLRATVAGPGRWGRSAVWHHAVGLRLDCCSFLNCRRTPVAGPRWGRCPAVWHYAAGLQRKPCSFFCFGRATVARPWWRRRASVRQGQLRGRNCAVKNGHPMTLVRTECNSICSDQAHHYRNYLYGSFHVCPPFRWLNYESE